MRVVLEGELSGNPPPVVISSLDEKNEVPSQIKSEWLGAEACVPVPLQALRGTEGPRFLFLPTFGAHMSRIVELEPSLSTARLYLGVAYMQHFLFCGGVWLSSCRMPSPSPR